MQADKALLDLVSTLRSSKTGVEARSAVLEGYERYDIIRGKDFIRWVQANMDRIDLPMIRGKSPEDSAQELGSLLLRREFLVRCDRKFKKPPPGQDRLIKFPKKVVLVTGPDAKTFAESDFYAWRYDPPVSAMVYVLSALAAIGVVLVCLFPVAPSWVKAGVVYLLMGLLTVLMGVLVLRSIVAAVSWIGTGRTVWILPNALADDKPMSELFSPMIAVQEPDIKVGDKSGYAKHLLLRALTASLLAGVTYILYTKSPGSDRVKQSAFRYRDELFDMLHVNDQKLLTKGNATEAVNEEAAEQPEKNEF